MGQVSDTKILLANTEDTADLEEQNVIDSAVPLPPAICSLDALRLSPEDLYNDIKDFEG